MLVTSWRKVTKVEFRRQRGRCKNSACATNNPQPCPDSPNENGTMAKAQINEMLKCTTKNTVFMCRLDAGLCAENSHLAD